MEKIEDIKIIFEDEDLLVLDKPAGITVNKSDTTKGEITVQDWVEAYLKLPKEEKVSNVSNGEKPFAAPDIFLSRAGIVHRLDKETSGILLVAKNLNSFEDLQRQFKERIVKKSYIALAHGKVEPEEGEIRVPVGRLPWNRKQFGVIAGGREAITKYKVLSIKYHVSGKESLTLLELYPETGRTHQIRVHLKYTNHPIFADFLYAGRKTARSDRKYLSRVFLHAAKISFIHPRTGKIISFENPLANELKEFLKTLG